MFHITCFFLLAQSNLLGCATDLSNGSSVGFNDLTVVLSQWNTPNDDANRAESNNSDINDPRFEGPLNVERPFANECGS